MLRPDRSLLTRRRIRLLAGVMLVSWIAACGGGASGGPACGWDLSSVAGQQANKDRLAFANQWILDNPGVPVPAPTSTFWHGDCPTPSQVPTPPVGEGDQPDD